MTTPRLLVNSLASGSSGNSILVRAPETSILIDAGISCRRLQASLLSVGQDPSALDAILITHEHGDHTKGALLFSKKFGTRLISSARTLSAFADAVNSTKVVDPGEGFGLNDLRIETFPIPHDAANPMGYCIHTSRHKMCYATDVGRATDALRDEIRDADLLILESNHDIQSLLRGPYPQSLKRRILSDLGHLSNDAAADLLEHKARSSKQATVWLAHLSKTNNSPSLALNCAKKRLAAIGATNLTVQVALRDHPSISWQAENTAFQLSMAL
jgi:phosphoribosyl 1,2-cyclic phosphodiesterase